MLEKLPLEAQENLPLEEDLEYLGIDKSELNSLDEEIWQKYVSKTLTEEELRTYKDALFVLGTTSQWKLFEYVFKNFKK